MTALRFVTWNCHHGSPSRRLADLAPHSPDIVFLQECAPGETLPLVGQLLTRRIGPRKGIAMGALNDEFLLTEMELLPGSGRAVLAASVSGPVSFTTLGIWSQGPRYVDDVMDTLRTYADVLRAGPAVVMGDLNSGTALNGEHSPSAGHSRIVDALADAGLVSAYHAFHNVEHGHEAHPTYRHQFKTSKPWHLDYCFVPANWIGDLQGAHVLDGGGLDSSDHLPLMVDFQLSQLS